MSTLTFSTDLSDPLKPYLPSSSSSSSPSLPFVTLTFATSLDSSLSLSPGVQTHLSGPLSKSMTHFLRSHHAAILIGVSTAVADDPGLNCRIEGAGLEKQPRPIVLDPNGRWEVKEDSRVIRAAKEGKGLAPIVLVSLDILSKAEIKGNLSIVQSVGGQYLGVPVDESGRFKWSDILSTLKTKLNIDSVMIEGGGSVINSLLEDQESKQFIDAVIITIAPTWLGKGGVVVSPERKTDNSQQYTPPRLKEVKWIPMGEDVVVCGRIS